MADVVFIFYSLGGGTGGTMGSFIAEEMADDFPDKIINVIQYSVGRAIWCCKNFPAEVKIKMAFDFRGQGIIVSKTRSLKNKIIEIIEKLKITNQISIEFLI